MTNTDIKFGYLHKKAIFVKHGEISWFIRKKETKFSGLHLSTNVYGDKETALDTSVYKSYQNLEKK